MEEDFHHGGDPVNLTMTSHAIITHVITADDGINMI